MPKSTLYDWLRYGAEDKAAGRVTDFAEFSDAVKRALAEAEVADLLVISQASHTHWQAAAWKLERRAPKRWGRRKQLLSEEDEDPDDQDVIVIEADGTEEQYIRAMRMARGETDVA